MFAQPRRTFSSTDAIWRRSALVPSGIFRRAYIRSYAQAIGLDPDVIAGEVLEIYPDPRGAVTTDAIAAAVDGAGGNAAPPTRLRYFALPTPSL